jgi:hypothetical protein
MLLSKLSKIAWVYDKIPFFKKNLNLKKKLC